MLWLTSIATMGQTPGHDVILIGDTASGTASTVLPFQTYNTTTSQQLILASEMNGAATITGIDFYCITPSTTSRGTCQVYLGHTVQSNLNSRMAPYSARFELVSTDTFACTTGWNHFELDSTFFYNGVDNLVLMVCAPSNYTTPSLVAFAESSTPSQLLARYANYPSPNLPPNLIGSGRQYRNVMRIHTTPVTYASTCPPPTLWFDSIGADAARMVWSPGYQDIAWVVRYITDGDSAWHSSGLVWGDTTYTLTGLTPNTLYEVRLTAFCTDTETTIVHHLQTNCTPDTIPFRQGFESLASLPACWSFLRGGTGGTGSLPGYNNNAHTGSRSLQMNGGSAILPLLNVPPDSLELQLWVRNRLSGNVPMQLVVGLIIDPLDMTTFVPFDTISIRNNEGWQPKIVHFGGYSRDMGRIAFVSPNPTQAYLCIDDVQVTRKSLCPTIMGVTVDEMTDTSALVRWPGTGPAFYEVTYGPYGFDPDTAQVISNIHADSLLLTGLDPYTRYSVYVRPECRLFTNWSPVVTFRTECALLDSVPFVEGMEAFATGTLPTDFPCWSGLAKVNTCVVNGSAAFPTHTGNRMLRWEQSLSSYGIQHVSLPAIDTAVLPMSSLQLEFWGKGNHYNHYTPYLIVGVMTDPDDMTTFQPVDTVEIGQEYMEHYVVSLENFYGPGRYVTLVDYSPLASNYWTAYLDDIVLSELPPCPEISDVTITGITDNSATLTIDSTRNAVAWQAYVDTVDSIPSAVALPLLNTRNVTISLDSSTTNYLWVRAICVKGDTSEWFGPVSIEPGAWYMRANRSDTLMLCGGTLYDDGGANSYAQPLQNSWITLLPSEPGHLVSISGSCWKGSFTEVLEIFDADSTLLWTSLGNVNNYYPHNILTFGPVTSSSGLLRLHFTTDSWGGRFDDTSAFIQVQVSCIPDTCVIKHLRADPAVPATDTSIAVTWECNGASLYEIEYGAVGFSLGSGTHATANTEQFILTGLHSLDRRDIYVRSICGVGDTGAWCHATFQTLPCPDAVYRDNYDSTLAPMSDEVSPLGMNRAQYTYTQTLIDSAYLSGLEGDITALAVRPARMAFSEYLAPVTIYLANVPDTAFDSTFIVPDSQHRFVKVIDSANFNHGLDTSWITMPFDHPFLWDGHSQVLVAALRNISGETSGGASYSAHRHRRNVTCWYADAVPIDIDSARTCYANNSVGDIRLFSNLCHSCPPVTGLHVGDITSHSILVAWDSTDNAQSYLLQYGPHPYSLVEGNDTIVTGNSCLIEGLAAQTAYDIYVRTLCGEDWYAEGYTSITGILTLSHEAIDIIASADLNLILQPNPATSQVSVQGIAPQEIVSIKVFNMSGQQVLSVSGSNQFVVDGWPSGSYIVGVLTSDKQYHYLKLIKK